MRTRLAVLLLLPFAALADPPDACTLATAEEIAAIAKTPVERVQPRRSGNPSECAFLGERRSAVVVISVREVKYAVRDEMHYERENLEKIYRAKGKELEGIGEGAYWLPGNKQLLFRKGKLIASVTFSTKQNQNEVDSSQVARLLETRL